MDGWEGGDTPPECDWHRLHPIIADIPPKIFSGFFFLLLLELRPSHSSPALIGYLAAQLPSIHLSRPACVFGRGQIKSNDLQLRRKASLNYCDLCDLHLCFAVKLRLTWKFSCNFLQQPVNSEGAGLVILEMQLFLLLSSVDGCSRLRRSRFVIGEGGEVFANWLRENRFAVK